MSHGMGHFWYYKAVCSCLKFPRGPLRVQVALDLPAHPPWARPAPPPHRPRATRGSELGRQLECLLEPGGDSGLSPGSPALPLQRAVPPAGPRAGARRPGPSDRLPVPVSTHTGSDRPLALNFKLKVEDTPRPASPEDPRPHAAQRGQPATICHALTLRCELKLAWISLSMGRDGRSAGH
jgi:hypothetical protein